MKNNSNRTLTDDPIILKIIEAARNFDHKALEEVNVNQRDKKTGFHAATILAYNRETEVIKFLKPYILGIAKDRFGIRKKVMKTATELINSQVGIKHVWDHLYKNIVVEGFIMGGHTDLALEWINKGADVNIAVSIAAKQGNDALVTLLLNNYKVNIHAAVYMAAEGGNEELVDSLLTRGANTSFAISGAEIGGHRNLTQRLLEQAKNEDNYEYALNKAVREAAGYEHKELAEWLIEEYKANPLEALNGAIWNKSFNFATYLISNYKILPEKISASYNDDLKSYFKKKKYNIYSFLSGITDNELRKAYIHHTATILDISPDKLSNNFSSILKTMEDEKLSFDDAYVYYVEKKYIACGISTPLGDYVASFYKVYTANAPITREEILIPSEILNKIAHFCIEHPKLKRDDKSNEQKYPPLSESGINKVINLWVNRINVVCFERTERIKAQVSELALLITTAYNDNFPAVITHSINDLYNSVTGFRDKLTEEKSDGRGNQI
ncbi:ankyrin repeat domain-containing protein [endosymbiont of Acanthamoeba sp. UWC8]|uniref:ankyrin repeat domain-containing protein n=1 Tax=endosymbiont of Acanthamoeba sp. UWC8 TaxID=86106 RepID=UPI0011DE4817|nr:ankyrin repeat domain-containing protein [endosymbiont of Acanthamoeba sp. UWC8]